MGSPATLPSSPKKNHTASVRRTNKPLVEKKRRARINGCLGQLKSLLLSAMKTESTQVSRLEKADILEMTVKYLRHIQCQPQQMASPTPSTVLPPTSTPSENVASAEPAGVGTKFSAGYTECAAEVIRYMESVTGMTDDIKTRLEHHLVGKLHRPTTPTAVSSPSSSVSSSSIPSASGVDTIQPQVDIKKENNEATMSNLSDNVVSPRHYQTALDLANMASNIVQQQQQQQQQQQYHHLQQQHEQQHQRTSSRPGVQSLPTPQPPTICASVPATPDTPPNTPPHMEMETDCYKNNSNNYDNRAQLIDNKMHYNLPSSSSLSPSSSEDDEEMTIAHTEENQHPSIQQYNLKNINQEDNFTHNNGNSQSPLDFHRLNPTNAHAIISPINLIKRRLPLSAYAIPLHIDIPESPSPSRTPSPSNNHPSNSRPGSNSNSTKQSHPTIHQDPHNHQHPHDKDNESLPTILYGLPETRLLARPSAGYPTSVTHRESESQFHYQKTHTSVLLPPETATTTTDKTLAKNSTITTCNLDNNYPNNTKCRVHPKAIRAIPFSSSSSSLSSSSSSSTANPQLSIAQTHPNQKQTLEPVIGSSQGRYAQNRIDNPHYDRSPSPSNPLTSPSPPTLTIEDATCVRPTPILPHPYPNPHHLTTTQKKRHSYSPDYDHNSPINGHAPTPTPHVAEKRKSPADEIKDDGNKNKNAIDMRVSSNVSDRKSETTDEVRGNVNGNGSLPVPNSHPRLSNNTIRFVDNGNSHLPPSAFKHPSIHHQRYQHEYNHYNNLNHYHRQQIESVNLHRRQFPNTTGEDNFTHNQNNINNANPQISTRFLQANTNSNTVIPAQNDMQYQRSPHNVNSIQPHHTSTIIHHSQNDAYSRSGHIPHQNYNQNHSHCIGMRPEGELPPQTLTTNSAAHSQIHFMNENQIIRTTEKVGHDKTYTYNNKTRAMPSIGKAETIRSRQNYRSALLPLALSKGDTITGQASGVNSYFMTSTRDVPLVARQEVGLHETQSQNRNFAKGRDSVNYIDYSGSSLITPLDNVDSSYEQVWRPW